MGLALKSQAVDVRGARGRVTCEADVAVSQVVDEEHDHIRPVRGMARGGDRQEQRAHRGKLSVQPFGIVWSERPR